MVLCIVMGLWACSVSVVVPEAATIAVPRPLFLLEHGRHTSLVLTRSDGAMLRFAYGDWRWYAQNDTGLRQAIPVLFLHTQAALGRQALPAPALAETIRVHSHVQIAHIHRLYASAPRVDALIERLESRFDATRDTLIRSQLYGLEFVYDPEPYRVSYNSNHAVAGWLGELGIEVRGNPIAGRWRFIPQ